MGVQVWYKEKTFLVFLISTLLSRVPADVRSTVYSCALAHGDETEWNFVFKKFMTTDNPSERSKLQSALSKTRNIWLLQKLVFLIFTQISKGRKNIKRSDFSWKAKIYDSWLA